MPECIAKRELRYQDKDCGERRTLVIRVFAPFEVVPGTVDFEVDSGVAACIWEIEGFPKKVTDTVYGADSLQALQIAIDLDGVLRSYRPQYDFYFPDGDPYFDDEAAR